jgi:Subtilase family/GEVED domain/Secretion system C-terminal sorting domain/Ig-like domain CHU_C associated
MNSMAYHKFVPLATLFFLFNFLEGNAQITTNTAILQRAGIAARQQENDAFQKLQVLAKQKGWPWILSLKNGRQAYLSGTDAHGYPLYKGTNDNIISAATIRTNLLWPGGSTGLNLNGSSAILKGRIALWDEAQPLHTHQELIGRISQGDNNSSLSDHSTHVAGTLIATGVNPVAKGMSFGAQQLLAYDFTNDISEMLAASPNLLISNHSYGSIAGWNYNTNTTPNRWEFWGNSGDTADYKFGYYDQESQMWDSISFNAPNYLIVKSAGNNRDVNGPAVGQPYWRYNASGIMVSAGNRPAGISNNDGYDIIPTYGCAKDILTIGAVNPIPGGYTQPSDVVMSDFSSWGPTDDGRIKPDLVADGVNVLSCISTANDAYAVYSGTSMSSPASAGSSFLLQDYYSKLHGGAFMRSATLKGILIHTADEAGIAPGPDYEFGWGLINMQKAASVLTSDTMATNPDQKIYENNLINGTSFTLPVVASGKGPLIATISWTDPPASVDLVNILNNPAKKLINDLDLRISNGTTTYMPWVLDRTDPQIAATTGDDTLNNVEKVVINNPIPGTSYNIKVTHKATLARGQQAYSLLVSGEGGQAYCASAPTSSAGTRIDSVNMSNLHNANPAGCTTYTDYTSLNVQLQSAQTIAFSIKLSSCDASNNPRVVKIYIDYNSNGTFTDSGENVAQSGVINGPGSFTGSFTTPGNLIVGNSTRMRIVVQETNDPTTVLPCGSYGNGETEDYSVQFISPANDVGVTQLVDPTGSACVSDSQRITLRIKNFGSSSQYNIPITVNVLNGANLVTTLQAVCPDTIPALSDVVYTLQTSFATVGGNTYTIVSRTNLSTDQDTANDQNTASLVITTGANTATGSAEICSSSPAQVSLKANTTDPNDVAVWYDSPNATTPVAAGISATTTVIPSNKTYYLGLNDISTKVGPPNKLVYPSGGYNAFSGNFVAFSSLVPVTIQSARLYIGSAGTITFTVADTVDFNASTGAYSYYPISSNTLNVYPTTPTTPALGVNINNAADTGAIYYLNLPVTTPGNHVVIIDCENGASIFRNNNLTSNPYPLTIPGVFSITGNSAIDQTTPTDTTFYQKYYYFFYDMNIQLVNCPGPRVPVVASTATPPVITLNGKVLTSSIATGNQWYLNDTAIAGATGQTDTIITPGVYTTVVTDSIGCSLTSNQILYSPNNGQFKISFYVSATQDVGISLLNTLGQRIYTSSYPGFSGVFSNQMYLPNLSAGVYFLKIQVGSKSYVEKIVVD